MPKVTFMENGYRNRAILVDGKKVGYAQSGGGEVWVYLEKDGKDEFFARFKYRSPSAVCRYTLRKLLEVRTPATLLEEYTKGRAAGLQLQDLGIPHYFAQKGT